MWDLLQAGLGLLILIGFCWGVFPLIRLFEPLGTQRPARRARETPGLRSGTAGAGVSAGRAPVQVSRPGPPVLGTPTRPRVDPCCASCAAGCQITGLVMGQAWGRGDDWWGRPFGEDGTNTEAVVFWGDDCCPDCATCPTCQTW